MPRVLVNLQWDEEERNAVWKGNRNTTVRRRSAKKEERGRGRAAAGGLHTPGSTQTKKTKKIVRARCAIDRFDKEGQVAVKYASAVRVPRQGRDGLEAGGCDSSGQFSRIALRR